MELDNIVDNWCTVVSRYFQCLFHKFIVCLKPFCIDFWCSFLFISRKSVQRRKQRFLAEIAEVTTYEPHDDPSWLWQSLGVNRCKKIMVAEGSWGILTKSGTTEAHDGSFRTITAMMIRPAYSSWLSESSSSTQFQELSKCCWTEPLDGSFCLKRCVISIHQG